MSNALKLVHTIMRGFLLFVLLPALPLPGTTLEHLSLTDMIAKSTSIVHGKVLSCRGELRTPVVYTRCKVSVTEQWKGGAAGVGDVYTFGGTAAGRTQAFPGAPSLTEGEEYVLFLWKGRSGVNQVIGFSQGVFNIQQMPEGKKIAFHRATSEVVLDSSGRPVPDTSTQYDLSRLRSLVLGQLADARQ